MDVVCAVAFDGGSVVAVEVLAAVAMAEAVI